MKSGNVVLGALAGVAIGAILGILFAPEKGTKTRRHILSKGEDFADDLKDKFDDLLDKITDKYEDTLHQADGMYSKGKSRYEEVKKEVKNTIS